MMDQNPSVVAIVYNGVIAHVFVPDEFIPKCANLVSSFVLGIGASDSGTDSVETPIELLSQFLKYCKPYDRSIAKVVLDDFESRYLGSKNVHIVCLDLGLSLTQVANVLNGYYSAWDLSLPDKPLTQLPAIFNDNTTKLMALFGGQGGASGYFDELAFLYRAYHPLVIEFIKQTSLFLNSISKDVKVMDIYKHGLGFIGWLENPEEKPSIDYLLLSPVSALLTAVTQFLQFLVTFKTLRVSPGELTKYFEVTVGHSHGILIATTISCSTDEESFYNNALKALGILMVTSAFGQLKNPLSVLDKAPKSVGSKATNYQPMVLVKGLSHEKLSAFISKFNARYSSKNSHIYVPVINTATQIVVAGKPNRVAEFIDVVSAECASLDLDQSRIPHSNRKPFVQFEYLSLTAPYHCYLYGEPFDIQYQYVMDKGWTFSSEDMKAAVRANDDGHDIRSEENLTEYLLRSNVVLPVNWPIATDYPGITHIIDFGPGGTRGFGSLAYRSVEGCGISVICASASVPGNPEFGIRADLYRLDLSSVIKAPNWTEQYSPTLLRTAFDNRINISTKMSRLLGKPPIMVSGMTPTTVNEELVATVLNSGYHIELACGGIHTRTELEDKVYKLAGSIEPGCSITLNLVYLNQDQFSFQYRAIVELRRKGVLIEGICIGGGVPSLDIATEIVDTIRDAGIRHIAFKPGSTESIRQVIEIAKKCPDFPVMLQWTGGRAGGHHSFEDVHQPILNTYRIIRKQSNIVLVAGSGFGGADDTFPYLTGEWSTRFGCAPMPFDGVLFGSCIMVSKESKAADGVKELIVAAPGVSDCDWEQTYAGPAGGVITIKSEYGEPIHVIANRCSLFWKELDSTVFSIPRKDRLKAVLDKIDYIISHLNSDHTRPWFGTLSDGRVVGIEDMTYLEVLRRLSALLYIKYENRWVHPSHEDLLNRFIHRIEERFVGAREYSTFESTWITDPHIKTEHILSIYPDIETQLLTSEDINYLISISKQRGQRPVPFIPVLDEDFETWFKKDTAWQSEDLACVPSQDPQRVLILQGPVAAQYSTKINIPVKDILDEINNKLVDKLVESSSMGSIDDIQKVEYLADAPPTIAGLEHIIQDNSNTEYIFTHPSNSSLLVENATWISMLSDGQLNWIYLLLTAPYILDDGKLVPNNIRNVLRPRVENAVRIALENNHPKSIEVTDSNGRLAVCIAMDDTKNSIDVVIYSYLNEASTFMQSQYVYCPNHPLIPFIKSDVTGNDSENRLFRELIQSCTSGTFDPPRTTIGHLSSSYENYRIDKDRFIQYLRVLGCTEDSFESKLLDNELFIPSDYVFVLVYQLFTDCIESGNYAHLFLKVVHQSNSISLVSDTRPLCTGDIISAKLKIISVLNTSNGTQITTKAVINRDDKKVAEVITTVAINGSYLANKDTFSSIDEQIMRVEIKEKHEISILESKEWFLANRDTIGNLRPGSVLEFTLKSEYRFKTPNVYSSVLTTGSVQLITAKNIPIHIGDVNYHIGSSFGNPIIEYLKRFGSQINTPVYFANGGYPIFNGQLSEQGILRTPQSNCMYSSVSGDYNPIHTNPYFADYLGLPTTITYGMCTSAINRAYIDRYAAGGHPERVVKYNVEFIDMVSPDDSLVPSFDHVGMRDGLMLIRGSTANQNGSKVLEFTAEVEQPPTAYVFTGQGMQNIGMGMDLYKSSSAARAVWDRGDQHFINKYGVSILDIVNQNPTKYTVHFDGERGSYIRDNYIDLISSISKSTYCHTFAYSKGLLHLTQFTQPALVLYDIAAIEDMREKGLVHPSSYFIGHSFGEFPALCAMNEVLSLEDTLDIVFYRGLLVQEMIECGRSGQPEYKMVAVNPSMVSSTFNEYDLVSIVDSINAHGTGVIKIINYNIHKQQYVVAGIVQQLKCLSLALNELSNHSDYSSELIDNTAKYSVTQVGDEMRKLGKVALERGVATIPLVGIDIPSHLNILHPIVDPFRKYIREKIKNTRINSDRLCAQYIPNLTGEPFTISREYLDKVLDLTESTAVKEILSGWDENISNTRDEKQQLIIQMLLPELLAYQIARPVQWISTQNHVLTKAKIERVIEIGPAPVLTDIVKRSAKAISTPIKILSIAVDSDEVYYRNKSLINRDESDEVYLEQKHDKMEFESIPKNDSTMSKKQIPDTTPKPLQSHAPSAVRKSAVSIPDVPFDPLFVIKTIVALKLKQSISTISDTMTIGFFSKGKSILQNEILGDLKREFDNNIFDISEELSLEELAFKITSFAGTFGVCTTDHLSRLFRSKLPGSFSQSDACRYLSLAYGLGPHRCDAVLLLALTSEPQAHILDDTEAKEWLDKIVFEYASINDLELSKSTIADFGSMNTDSLTAADVKALEKAQISQMNLSKHLIKVYAESIGIDLRNGDRASEQFCKERDSLQQSLNKLNKELGSEFVSGVEAMFDPLKIRRFNSYWNWVQQDAIILIYGILDGKIDIDSVDTKESIHMLRMRSTPALIKVLSFCIKQFETLDEGHRVKSLTAAITKIKQECEKSLNTMPTYSVYSVPTRPHTYINSNNNIVYEDASDPNLPNREAYVKKMCSDYGDGRPLVYIKTRSEYSTWSYNTLLTKIYLDNISQVYGDGMSFSGMHVLITGCGKTSIGEEILKGFLSGGAKVVATTSSYSRKTMLYFEDIYKRYGSRGSELIVVPFNQGSNEDVKRIVDFIYRSPDDRNGGLGWDIDIVAPFAALPNLFGDITEIGSHAELAFRAMLTNTHRLFGEIVLKKMEFRCSTRITRALLPFSINHGQFNGGGLYSESKIALEALMNRWYAETWSKYMSVVGLKIGWTRGTIQVLNTSIASERMEKSGIYTFTTKEMAAFILCILSNSLCAGDVLDPVVLDLGGRNTANNSRDLLIESREIIVEEGNIRRNIATDLNHDVYAIHKSHPTINNDYHPINPRANYKPQFTKYRSYDELSSLHHLQGMINLDKVVVVTGFGEVGPYGSSATRWEMESFGEFSLEGCVELAWIMGYIKFFDGILKSTNEQYVGWVDAKTGEPVLDVDVKAKYEKHILKHTGIRLIEPELHYGYNPNTKLFMRKLQIEHDMDPIKVSKEDAEQFKLKHGDRVDVWKNENRTWSVRFLKGATIILPKAMQFDQTVSGQIPTGWDPIRYGIPEDIVKYADPIMCYTLVATVEALLRSGITDPYELYKYFHVSKVGNTVGSGLGGIRSTAKMYLERLIDDSNIQTDIFQESIINTVSAYVNMLLISSSGPVTAVAGACATSILSINAAVNMIQSGQAKAVIAGGVEDFGKESSYEFAQMGATNSTTDETSHGRTPSEMCRPCTSTRKGFMESEGAGIVVLMSASAAIEMGVPIYGIVALSSTATDKVSRSVLAPGKGILTTASESHNDKESEVLNFNYRKAKLERHLQLIDQWESEMSDCSESEIKKLQNMRRAAQDEWGNEFWKKDSSISPLRGSLAVWGLDADDIGVASFHGTSTVLNDINESDIFNAQFKHLGRTPGNTVPVIAQKWLTGHPKGAAAAWMLNGVLQVLDTGLIPGNRNADNIDKKLEQFDYLWYPSKSIQTRGIKAGLLKSFGFGQSSGELLIVHSDYILATLSRDDLEQYQERVREREKNIYRYWHDTFVGNHTFVQVKDEPPYTKEQEKNVYLDPNARVRYDPKTKQYRF